MATDVEVSDFLEHFGILGMKWGVRNTSSSNEVYRLQSNQIMVDSTLHQSTQKAGKEVAGLIGQRYGFNITAINSITPNNPEHARGTIGYVQNTPGQKGGAVYANPNDLRKVLKEAEKQGWFGPETGNVKSFLTHESAHAIFHAQQQVKSGFLSTKVVGGEQKARDSALKAAMNEAKEKGISEHEFANKVSGYSAAAKVREETEAEMFSQYHWSPNPPSFIKIWGETLHREMGIDDTPFRESS